ncbi:MarR family winged helix-turn-helix transcriptional regulator [Halovulum sp. GXIMD14794]
MSEDETATGYRLDDQVGFILRRVQQRHVGIFAEGIPELTPTQFAALAKLCELGQTSQNALGRATAMDAATIKGVVDRLRGRGLVSACPDPEDMRRVHLAPTEEGRQLFDELSIQATEITARTLAPLTRSEQRRFLQLLRKLV